MTPRDRQFDVIIVGAGSAGCVLASRLSEDHGRRVLLLEAGRYYGGIDAYPEPFRDATMNATSLPGNPASWSFKGRLTDTLSYPVTRGKVVGGSSAVNGAQFLRARPEDYDEWAAMGNPSWSYAELLPYLIRQETDLDFAGDPVHGHTGPMPVKRPDRGSISPISAAFAEACMRAGYAWDPDMNGPRSGGVGLIPYNTLEGIRQNAAVCYLEPLSRRAGLEVRDRTHVERVLFAGKRAIGVTASGPDGRASYYADEVILSASGYNSPHLLVLSGIGDADVLKGLGIPVVHHAPSVGADFMDHPGVGVPFRTAPQVAAVARHYIAEVQLNYASWGSLDPDHQDMKMAPFLFSKMSLIFSQSRGRTLRQRMGGAAFLTRPVRTLRGVWGASPKALAADFGHRSDLLLHCGLAQEQSRGRLHFTSASPHDLPVIEFRYLSSPADAIRMRRAVRLAVQFLADPSFSVLGAVRTAPGDDVLADDQALDHWVAGHLQSAQHTSGTCRMGPDGATSVVGPDCRVHGVDGLRVVDISVLPKLTRRGPNASVTMLAERAADLIKGSP
jgi:choline dehydrogenase